MKVTHTFGRYFNSVIVIMFFSCLFFSQRSAVCCCCFWPRGQKKVEQDLKKIGEQQLSQSSINVEMGEQPEQFTLSQKQLALLHMQLTTLLRQDKKVFETLIKACQPKDISDCKTRHARLPTVVCAGVDKVGISSTLGMFEKDDRVSFTRLMQGKNVNPALQKIILDFVIVEQGVFGATYFIRTLDDFNKMRLKNP